MKVVGDARLSATRSLVSSTLADPAAMSRAIPGCGRWERVGVHRYRVSVTAAVASVDGTYDGEVWLEERPEPDSWVVRASGRGASGTVDATVLLRLAAEDDGTTLLSYDADVTVGGMLGGIGQRMLVSAARRLADAFVAGIEQQLSRPTDDAEPARQWSGAATPSATSTGSAGATRDARRTGELLAAAVGGAAIAVVGVQLYRRLRRLSRG